MGNFSRDTFDELKHYVSVRMQQGVPLVDADWNEHEDIRKHELRTFLKWFIGNGVPKGNDGFRIVPLDASNNDFTIKGGDGTAEGAGRCLVEGWDVMIKDDIRYKEQKLFLNKDDEANKWGVEPLEQLSPPSSGERPDTVYLDVWEREVDAQADSNLVNPSIGIETCVRLKREWVVRVAENLSDEGGIKEHLKNEYLKYGLIFPPDHVYYPLALLKRTANQNVISKDDITDLRRTGLAVLSEEITIKDGNVGIGTTEPKTKLHVDGNVRANNLTAIQKDVHQITTDANGSSYTLCHYGQPELRVSLRDSINAILRGTLPTTPPDPLTIEASNESLPRVFKDQSGVIWVFWRSVRDGRLETWYNRWVNGKWEGQIQLTSGGYDEWAFPLEDRNGNIWVFWNNGQGAISYNIRVNGNWQGEKQVASGITTHYRYLPYALKDRSGNIRVFWHSNSGIRSNRFINGEWEGDKQLTTEPADILYHFAIEGNNDDIHVFWGSNRSGNEDIWYCSLVHSI